MNDIVKKKKRKFLLIILIIIATVVVLVTAFGLIDYFRTKNGKRPIFIYNTVNVTNFDVQMAGFEDVASPSREGTEYYGIGYKVSICDNKTDEYVFSFGHKQIEQCTTSLNCTEKEEDNFITTHDFSFYDDKLFLLTSTLLRPIDRSESEEDLAKGIKEINDIVGAAATYKKINESTYQITISCNLLNIASEDIEKGCLISYFESSKIPSLTKTEITNYYDKTMTCK